MSDDNVIDFYDNKAAYTPPCCRPGGRCTTEHVAVPEDVALVAEIREKLRRG